MKFGRNIRTQDEGAILSVICTVLKSNKFCNARWKRRPTIGKSKHRVIYSIAEEATGAFQFFCLPECRGKGSVCSMWLLLRSPDSSCSCNGTRKHTRRRHVHIHLVRAIQKGRHACEWDTIKICNKTEKK
jgi:hypothetical protein